MPAEFLSNEQGTHQRMVDALACTDDARVRNDPRLQTAVPVLVDLLVAEATARGALLNAPRALDYRDHVGLWPTSSAATHMRYWKWRCSYSSSCRGCYGGTPGPR
jgi:hypothetical protein